MISFISASEILTGEGIRLKDGKNLSESDMGRLVDGAIVVDQKQNKIVWIGTTSEWREQRFSGKVVDLGCRQAIIPGLIDCHTHLVFGGDRADEFSRRSAGESYESIAKSGGGIQATVRATRESSEDELLERALLHAEEAYFYGVRTLEVKSGYGLDLETELKILRVIQRLSERYPQISWVATYMGAHAIRQGMSETDALREIVNEHLPAVARQGIAQFCDIFVDPGYFGVESVSVLAEAARQFGIRLKVHADELSNTGATAEAVQCGAISVEHLLRVSDDGVRALAQSETTAVLLPGTALFLKSEYAPARRLIQSGVRVAIATDFNPGSCPVNCLPWMMTLGALGMGMTKAEILASVTYNAARALSMQKETGSLMPGLRADIAILPFDRFEGLYYRAGFSAKTFPILGWRDYWDNQ